MVKMLPALAALTVATALVVPTVSQAQDTRSARVSYADLDLASNVGQDRLQRRIVYAAKSVCETADVLDLDFTAVVKECRTDAIAGAQPAFHEAVAAAERRGTVTVLDTASLVVSRPSGK